MTTSATDCAIVVTIPFDRASLETAWARGSDYLRSNLPGVRDVDDVWRRYGRYAEQCGQVLSFATKLKVTVVREATLADLASAMSAFPVVTLLAHSCDADVRASDVVDVDAVIEAMPEIVEATGGTTSATPLSPSAPDHQSVADWLNVRIDATIDPVDTNATEVTLAAQRARAYTQRWRRRRAIEAIVRPALRTGVGVEFADAFHPVEQIDAALPVVRDTLDLTVCESLLLGQLLRARRPGGVILSNTYLTSPDIRLALYKQTLWLMERRRIPYADAAMMLRTHMRRTRCPD